MLKSLKEYDHKTVERVLSAYTTALLPSPGVGFQPDLPVDPAVYESVKEEIHGLLKIAPSDLSKPDRAKVFQFLAREMSEVALARADIKRIKQRIGERGELRPDLYEIQFEEQLDPEILGVRPSHVVDAIRHPDSVEEVLTDTALGRVIHIKTHNKMNDRDRFSLFAISRREGHIIEVLSAWRIYHADIGVSKSLRPLELFKAFLETYGLSFRCGSYQGKFLLYDRVEASSGTRMDEIIKLPPNPRGGKIIVNFDGQKSTVARLYALAFVFVLDHSKYVTDLRRRGVQISELSGDLQLPWLP